MSSIKWNPRVKLILSDVDETVADLYVPAGKAMIKEIASLLEKGIFIFLITGQGLDSVRWRIIDKIPKKLRKRILVSHCSGAEVWGFDEKGEVLESPYYSLYGRSLTDKQKAKWREIVQKLIKSFRLKVFPTMPVLEFKKKTNGDPFSIMLEDRGPQITFEVVNGYDLEAEQANKLEFVIPQTHGSYDLRLPIVEKASELFEVEKIPVTPRIAGVFAIDFALKGVSKETSVKFVLGNADMLKSLGLDRTVFSNPDSIEIWGDKFSEIRGGSDRHMCEAVDPKVRAIDFREENPEEFPKGFNIVVWNGRKHLHEGLLEYLQGRTYE